MKERRQEFLGELSRKVDGKGRVVLPAEYRDLLDGDFYVTRGRDRCLYVFPWEVWEKKKKAIGQLDEASAAGRAEVRAFFSGATRPDLDSAGRVQLSFRLREYAGLSQDVIFVGAGEYAEIWAAEAWARYQPSAMAAYSGGQEDSPQAND
ncbi:MAG: cell division/cell wall cluster transcriptional repressor MraZ [bacterium]|nr:cell division/cell wall cluster transcriptional repressor MraZ [bacterium]MDE0352599.1 cell division/cell wall cluster transcriptional repressor MraZ [bacterium]